jgi:hypothetical protein
VLLGWVSRELIYGDDRSFATDPKLLDPLAIVRGRFAGHWRLRDGRVELDPASRLSRSERAELESDAEAVELFLRPVER